MMKKTMALVLSLLLMTQNSSVLLADTVDPTIAIQSQTPVIAASASPVPQTSPAVPTDPHIASMQVSTLSAASPAPAAHDDDGDGGYFDVFAHTRSISIEANTTAGECRSGATCRDWEMNLMLIGPDGSVQESGFITSAVGVPINYTFSGLEPSTKYLLKHLSQWVDTDYGSWVSQYVTTANENDPNPVPEPVNMKIVNSSALAEATTASVYFELEGVPDNQTPTITVTARAESGDVLSTATVGKSIEGKGYLAVFRGLTPETSYYYEIRASVNGGNYTAKASGNFQTTAAPAPAPSPSPSTEPGGSGTPGPITITLGIDWMNVTPATTSAQVRGQISNYSFYGQMGIKPFLEYRNTVTGQVSSVMITPNINGYFDILLSPLAYGTNYEFKIWSALGTMATGTFKTLGGVPAPNPSPSASPAPRETPKPEPSYSPTPVPSTVPHDKPPVPLPQPKPSYDPRPQPLPQPSYDPKPQPIPQPKPSYDPRPLPFPVDPKPLPPSMPVLKPDYKPYIPVTPVTPTSSQLPVLMPGDMYAPGTTEEYMQENPDGLVIVKRPTLAIEVNAPKVEQNGAVISGMIWRATSIYKVTVTYREKGSDVFMLASAASSAAGQFSLGLSNLKSGTTYEYRVTVENQSVGPLYFTTTIAPQIKIEMNPPKVESNGATLSGTIFNASGIQLVTISYREKDSDMLMLVQVSSSAAGAFLANLTNLRPGTTYLYNVSVGNLSTGWLSFVTPAAPIIKIEMNPPKVESNGATLSGTIFNASGIQLVTISYREKDSDALMLVRVSSSAAGAFIANLTNLRPGTTYLYNVSVGDQSTGWLSFVTPAAPIIKIEMNPPKVESNAAVISGTLWNATTTQTVKISYREKGSDVFMLATTTSGPTGIFSFGLSNLKSGITYEYTVSVGDQSEGPLSFTTTIAPQIKIEMNPPKVESTGATLSGTLFNATGSQTVSISYREKDSDALMLVRVSSSAAGAFIANLTNLRPGTTYLYNVSVGNQSTGWLSFTTPLAPTLKIEMYAPKIEGTTAVLSGKVFNSTSSQSVSITYWAKGSNAFQIVTATTTPTGLFSVTLPNLSAGTTYEYRVTVGNQTEGPFSFTTYAYLAMPGTIYAPGTTPEYMEENPDAILMPAAGGMYAPETSPEYVQNNPDAVVIAPLPSPSPSPVLYMPVLNLGGSED